MGMNLWEIYATLGVDTSQYDKAMDDAIAKAKTLNDTLNGATVGGSASGGGGTTSTGSGMSTWKVTVGNLMSDVVRKGAQLAWDFTVEGIDLASAKNEVQNVVDVTFGSYSDALNEWAKNAKAQYGIGEVSAKQYAGLFGDMLSSAGFAGDELYTMATGLTGLVGDIASFRDESFDEVFTRLYSGMVGETEAIRRYGVNMTVANMEDYSGLDWKSATAIEQFGARYDYIMAHTLNAQGDFARTLDDSLANQQRLMEENIKELQTKWGEGFLGVATNVFSNLNEMFGSGEPTLEETFAAYDQATAKASADIEDTAEKARVLLDVMDDLEQQGRNRADDPLWTASLRELSSLMPGLSSQIDLTSGSLSTSTDSIREQTEAWRLDALAAAETAAQISKVGALETTEGRKADAEINLAYAQSRMNTELEKILPAAQAMNEALTDNSTGRLLVGGRYDGTVEGARRLLTAYENQKGLLSFTNTDLTETEKAYYETLKESVTAYDQAATEAASYQTEIDNLSAQIEAGKTVIDDYVTSLDQSAAGYAAGFATGSAYTRGMADGLSSLPKPSIGSAGFAAGDMGIKVDGTHATGLDYVPFDGYVAEVHQREAILTAAEADAWRKGRSGQTVDTSAIASSITGAIRAGFAGAAVYMDGEKVGNMVTDRVSRNMGRKTLQRRHTG